MTRRFLSAAILLGTLVFFAGCTNKKVQNPIANVNSKQPDKVLFDRAMDAMKHNKYDVARITLQTLINTYPDSEYVARAKLAVGDSWYAEGGSAGLAQAEIEYKDFITFFPNMPEAAEAQLKVANIHYRQMEKADRDFTHAKRAEDEYRQLLLQFPDSKLVPEAKQRLLEVQEVLAEREYRIGRFYYLRESYPAAIARLRSLTDAYPLYSEADDALFLLGDSYERQIERVRAAKGMKEADKGKLIQVLEKEAGTAYSKIITRYPVMDRAADAKKRLEAMHQPVPQPTPEAIAQNKAEQASRGSLGMMGKMMLNLHRHPDMSVATKVGEPTLVDPKQTSATDVAQQINADFRKASGGGTGENSVAGQIIGTGGTPGANEPTPRSDNPPAEGAPAPEQPAAPPAGTGGGGASGGPAQPAAPLASGPVNGSAGNENTIPELIPSTGTAARTQPAAGSAAAPDTTAAPAQSTDSAASSSSSSSQSTSGDASSGNGSQAGQGGQTQQQDDSSSSSKKKKKKKLGVF